MAGCRGEEPGAKAAADLPKWRSSEWTELADAFVPWGCRARERKCLEGLLHATSERSLGAFSTLWELQAELSDDDFAEEELHHRLERKHPQYQPLLEAIRKYEGFARSLQDGFDVLRAEATARDAHGYVVTDIARDKDFVASVNRLHTR